MVLVLEAVRQSVYPERRAKGGALFHIIVTNSRAKPQQTPSVEKHAQI